MPAPWPHAAGPADRHRWPVPGQQAVVAWALLAPFALPKVAPPRVPDGVERSAVLPLMPFALAALRLAMLDLPVC